MHKRRRQRDRVQRVRFSFRPWGAMVVEIDCPIHGRQFARSVFASRLLTTFGVGLLKKRTRSVNPDREKQAGGECPRKNSASRRARMAQLLP